MIAKLVGTFAVFASVFLLGIQFGIECKNKKWIYHDRVYNALERMSKNERNK